jgi:hypothetical protein
MSPFVFVSIVVLFILVAVLLWAAFGPTGRDSMGRPPSVPRMNLPDGRYVPGPNEEVPAPWANDDDQPAEVAPCDYQGECLLPTDPPPDRAA